MNKISVIIGFLLIGFGGSKAQQVIHIEVDQPDPLMVQIGALPDVCAGAKVYLGTNMHISNPIGDLVYYWFPGDLLSDPTAANPVARINETTTFSLRVMDSRGCIAEDEVTIKAALCDALVGYESSRSMRVYPNPAHDRVFLELLNATMGDQATLTLVDALGQTVFVRNYLGMRHQSQVVFSVQGLSAGVYSVKLVSGNTLFVNRIQIN